ncbi:MAG: methyltransferase [Holosporaceae bacterium]|nr:methyltransferase [Holosporaceae bacterium]
MKLLQPKVGYRVAVDPIILAAFTTPRAGRKILDVGCGSGVISLILKLQEQSLRITALDIDAEMCCLCRRNAEINAADIRVVNGDIGNAKDIASLKNECFDHVVTNPPFFERQSSRISETKRTSHFETLSLDDWIAGCLGRLKNGGTFSMIHLASRAGDILGALKNNAGSVQIIPIFPKADRDAGRVIILARKSGKSPTKIRPGIIVHNADGSYSDTMRRILSGNFRTAPNLP